MPSPTNRSKRDRVFSNVAPLCRLLGTEIRADWLKSTYKHTDVEEVKVDLKIIEMQRSIDETLKAASYAAAGVVEAGMTIEDVLMRTANAAGVKPVHIPTTVLFSGLASAGLGGSLLAGITESIPCESIALVEEGPNVIRGGDDLTVIAEWDDKKDLRRAQESKADSFGSSAAKVASHKVRVDSQKSVASYIVNLKVLCSENNVLVRQKHSDVMRPSKDVFQSRIAGEALAVFPLLPDREDVQGYRRASLAFPIGYDSMSLVGPMNPHVKVSKPSAHSSIAGPGATIDWGKLGGHVTAIAEQASRVSFAKNMRRNVWKFRLLPGAFQLNFEGCRFDSIDIFPLLKVPDVQDAIKMLKMDKGQFIDSGPAGTFALPLLKVKRAIAGRTAVEVSSSLEKVVVEAGRAIRALNRAKVDSDAMIGDTVKDEEVKRYLGTLGASAAGFTGAQNMALQLLSWCAKRHSLAFAYLIKRLNRTKDRKEAIGHISEFLKVNHVGSTSFGATLGKLPGYLRNHIIRKLYGNMQVMNVSAHGSTLECGVHDFVVAVFRSFDDSNYSYAMRTLSAIDSVPIRDDSSTGKLHPWDRSFENNCDISTFYSKAMWSGYTAEALIAPGSLLSEDRDIAMQARARLESPKEMAAALGITAISTDDWYSGLTEGRLDDLDDEDSKTTLKEAYSLASEATDETVEAADLSYEEKMAEVYNGERAGILSSRMTCDELDELLRWVDNDTGDPMTLRNMDYKYWSVLRTYLRTKYIAYWDATNVARVKSWNDMSADAHKKVIITQQKKAFLRTWLKDDKGLVPHPLIAAASSTVKHIRRHRLKRNAPAADVSMIAANELMTEGWFYAEKHASDCPSTVNMDELYRALWDEIKYCFNDAWDWSQKVTRVGSKEASRMLGNFKSEVESVYRKVNEEKAIVIGNHALEAPDQMIKEGGDEDLDDFLGLDIDVDIPDVSSGFLDDSEVIAHPQAASLGVPRELWSVFTAWAAVNADKANPDRDSGLILSDFYSRNVIDIMHTDAPLTYAE